MKAQTRLALDCSAEGLSLALQVKEDKVFSVQESGARTSDLLPTALQRLFTESATTVSNLTEIRLTVGPGSFTGIRLGLATAQALQRLNPAITILGFSSLQALATQIVATEAPQTPFTLILDAAGAQAYTQTFTATGAPATEPACLPLSEMTPYSATYAQASLFLPARPLAPLGAATLWNLPESLSLAPYPVYLKPLTYKKVAE